jgi:hypothetical protein
MNHLRTLPCFARSSVTDASSASQLNARNGWWCSTSSRVTSSRALLAYHPDYAALRRYLVEEDFLARENGVYWRAGGSVEL